MRVPQVQWQLEMLPDTGLTELSLQWHNLTCFLTLVWLWVLSLQWHSMTCSLSGLAVSVINTVTQHDMLSDWFDCKCYQYSDTAWHALWLWSDCKCYQCSNGLTDVLPMLPFWAGVIHFFFSLTPSMQESIVFTGGQAQHCRIVNILMKYINQEYETKSRTAEFH